MRVALVHDYLNEYGGAERVLMALSEIWPDAPIYTAFAVGGSTAQKAFAGKKVVQSWFSRIPGASKLYSPLRFLIPKIWNSFNFSDFDLVITSASWYITKGMKRGTKTKEICYCHTPPRWLYGYATSINWQKYKFVRIYGMVVGHFLRMYDFERAQKVDQFVANSKNVAERIWKFYRKPAVVIYPPVSEPNLTGKIEKKGYLVIVGRIVGGKGIELAAEAAKRIGFKLKVVGESAGLANLIDTIKGLGGENVELLGYVSEETKWRIVAEAKALLAFEKDVDFGITPVEAMMCGTPVIAYKSGGYKETVIEGKNGVLFDDYSVNGVGEALKRLEKKRFEPEKLKQYAIKFSGKEFKVQMLKLAGKYARVTGS